MRGIQQCNTGLSTNLAGKTLFVPQHLYFLISLAQFLPQKFDFGESGFSSIFLFRFDGVTLFTQSIPTYTPFDPSVEDLAECHKLHCSADYRRIINCEIPSRRRGRMSARS